MFQNLINLPEAEFLAFFVVFSAAVGAVVVSLRHAGERTDPVGDPEFADPCELAYLRGGRSGLGYVVLMSLVARRFLEPSGNRIIVRKTGKQRRTYQSLDLAFLERFVNPPPTEPAALLRDAIVREQIEGQ